MIKTFAAASIALGLALAPFAAFAQTDMSGGAMPAKPMADKPMHKKPMMKHGSMTHHSMAKKPMAKPMAKDGEMQPKM